MEKSVVKIPLLRGTTLSRQEIGSANSSSLHCMDQSLKEQNCHKITGFVTANICFYILVIQSNSIISDDWLQSLKNLYSMAPEGASGILKTLLED